MALSNPRFKSRKALRKEARKAKKQRRNEYYARRGKRKSVEPSKESEPIKTNADRIKSKKNEQFKSLHERQDYAIKEEKRKRRILDAEIKKKRMERLIQDNLEEEKEIKKLEKQLKFRKGKRSGAFALDGLDYLLDICDRKISTKEGEKAFEESDTEFDNDLATVTGQKKSSKEKKDIGFDDGSVFSESDQESKPKMKGKSKDRKMKNKNLVNIEESDIVIKEKNKDKGKGKNRVTFIGVDNDIRSDDMSFSNGSDIDSEDNGNLADSDEDEEVDSLESLADSDNESLAEEPPLKKKKSKSEVNVKSKARIKKEVKKSSEGETSKKNKKKKENKKKQLKGNRNDSVNDENEFKDSNNVIKKSENDKNSEVWEDIYGRTRDKEGNVISIYRPPHLRKALENESVSVSKNKEKLLRLRKQLKGLLNRLAENNMASISSQIEQLYMSHSRNEINETMKDLYTEAIVTEVLTPERLIAEHAMLIAILHGNIGSEVGAYFLQSAVSQFDKMMKEGEIAVEDKRINNLLLFIMQLYNFQIFHSKLMFDIIHELMKNLQEKQIELLLLTLRTVGFSLRKDDPVALKSVVLKIQELSSSLASNDENYSRMKFMVEIVSAIKNNNVSKIPNYNPELVEHLKKCMKVLIRKGNFKTELNISLQDLLNAETRGRWWVVGSAWTGSGQSKNPKTSDSQESTLNKISFNQKLLDLAKKQRMNTDVRRTVFCTMMSAEDYLDAFEKLMKLGLKGAVEREIINVLIHCSLQEKDFNPYYFHLANKFCICDRKYQIMIQYAIWDKIKELSSLMPIQVTNLAKFLGNVILNKGLPLSVLKVVQFSELDKVAVKFIRQVLLTILLTDAESVANVFSRIINSSKLKVFRDGIRLFLHHFVLKNVKSNADENSDHLIKMIDIADKVLTSSDLSMIF